MNIKAVYNFLTSPKLHKFTRRSFLQSALITTGMASVGFESLTEAQEIKPEASDNIKKNQIVKNLSLDKNEVTEDRVRLEKILEFLNPNLTIIPTLIPLFNESWKLIDNNLKNGLDTSSLRYTNSDTLARAISCTTTVFTSLALRPGLSFIGNKLTNLSQKDLSDYTTISTFHLETLFITYPSNMLVKILRDTYIQALQDEKYGNDSRNVPLSKIYEILKTNKEKIAQEVKKEFQDIKGIPKSYIKEGLGKARGYIDHIIFILSYLSAGENIVSTHLGIRGNTGTGRFVADINRAGLIYRRLLSKDSVPNEYNEQLIRCTAESVTWPGMYLINGLSQSAIDASGLIKNTDKSLAMANLRELLGNLVFMGMYLCIKAPTQKSLENKTRKDLTENKLMLWEKLIKKYIEP